MNKITIAASKSYDVLTAPGLIEQAGLLIRQTLGNEPRKACIVSDSNVDALYRTPLKMALQAAGFTVISFVFPPGEDNKNMATVTRLLEFLAERDVTRSDILVALGGGITGDITGFAAASYLRGIKYVQMPTTLLAAVDSSVGGKTGVNLTSGKNLAGAFWQPSLVIFDTNTIKTLSYDLLLDGVAESIKAGVIADKSLFELTERIQNFTSDKVITRLAAKAIKVKQVLVEADERDTGARQLLNLGHTVGHAIEKCSGFSISHGHAVAMGMDIVARACKELEWSEEDCHTPIHAVLEKFKFPLDCPYTAAQLAEAALKDKKRKGDTITLAVPITLGNCQLVKLPVDKLENFIQKGLPCE